MSRVIPLYVERAMLRLMDDPELVRTVGRLMPYATREVGVRLYNAALDNIANGIRKAAANDPPPDRATCAQTRTAIDSKRSKAID